MFRHVWTKGSLRFWVAVGMLLTVVPLAASAIGGYVMIDRHVIGPFRDVAMRQHDEIGPVQYLRLLLWESGVPIDEYLDSGKDEKVAQYRDLSGQIAERFAALQQKMQAEAALKSLIDGAYEDWKGADAVAVTIIAVKRAPGDAEGMDLADQFDTKVAAINTKLKAVNNALMDDIDEDHADAEKSYVWAETVAGIAGVVSILAMIGGIVLIGRFMLASVDRLIDGAARFASGDREHRIEIQVPPELRRVAQEFNHMIVQIHTAEQALADVATHDALTGLLNRRAFDAALAETFVRIRRLDEKTALLMLDLDHFKRINDTFGHDGGDAVLRDVAQTMQSAVRDIDKVFRIGGEEFAILLQGADLAAARLTAERLRAAVAGLAIAVGGQNIAVTVSGGIALARRGGSAADLIKMADTALYAAKTGGRNCVLVASADGERGL